MAGQPEGLPALCRRPTTAQAWAQRGSRRAGKQGRVLLLERRLLAVRHGMPDPHSIPSFSRHPMRWTAHPALRALTSIPLDPLATDVRGREMEVTNGLEAVTMWECQEAAFLIEAPVIITDMIQLTEISDLRVMVH